ncbi:MAG: TIGR04283 family arsenosugar biosynthesis glycosyltransferase [Opitutales bacterium]
MRVDVIVPVFRDNAALKQLLEASAERDLSERIQVVFGEPDAAGQALAERCGVTWTRAERAGRASQMNHGAASAEGDVLLFLHADSQPPPDALEAIQDAVFHGAVGGAFTRRFDTPSRLLRFACWLADWRGRALGIFLGDQGLFVRREVFEALGGFDEEARYEDLDFSQRLRGTGRTILLPQVLISSARRFQRRGVVRQSLSDFLAIVSSRARSCLSKPAQ